MPLKKEEEGGRKKNSSIAVLLFLVGGWKAHGGFLKGEFYLLQALFDAATADSKTKTVLTEPLVAGL